ncbi:MAG: hypothetical protein C3F06_03370 [Candidatus Methanoperedenaceae archaeon]|nr:MAG: hypothetical protein C3F06_03370 [Candidatus Methanoperedenaceae archaeon]
MRKAYQFRIYPHKNQEVKFNSTLSTCRHLYNDALAERKRQAELNELSRRFDVCPWGKPEWMNYWDQTGIDVGLTSLLTMSNGEQIEPPEFLRTSEKRLARGQLVQFTTYKAGYAVGIVELVDPRGTSQICICGHPVPKTLSMRIHKCPNCGLVAGRHHVSANVIENRSIYTVGTTEIEACLSSLSTDTMTQEAPAR